MRELNVGTKKFTKVIALDERGNGNANHKYSIIESNVEIPVVFSEISFQNGAIRENGINGIYNEDLIGIVIDRLEGFQTGEFSCIENAVAITKLEEAMMWLNKRTTDRINRGVIGRNIK